MKIYDEIKQWIKDGDWEEEANYAICCKRLTIGEIETLEIFGWELVTVSEYSNLSKIYVTYYFKKNYEKYGI